MEHDGLMVSWMRCYWDEEDTWFYFEVDEDGMVSRQIELQGPDRVAVAAASLLEWHRASEAGVLGSYESRFGFTASLPVSEWEGHVEEILTAQAFEEVWTAARRQIAARRP